MSTIDDDHWHGSDSPIDDVAYLTRSEHRVRALDVLTTRPRSRSELCELTGASSSTVRRTLREFEDRAWIRRDGHRYEITQLGAFVAAGVEELIDRVETERKLRDVWEGLPNEDGDFAIEMWSDAIVTTPTRGDPYAPVNRFESLLRETTEVRFVGAEIALIEPCTDAFLQLADHGRDVAVIQRPSCTEYVRSTYPEWYSAALERRELTVLEYDDQPSSGIGLFDHRIVVSCYDRYSGAVRAVIETDGAKAREWAESVFSFYRAVARPLVPELAVR